MKIALIIAYVLIAVLAIVVFMQWKFIKAVAPAAAGNTGSSQGSGNTTGHRTSAADQGDGSASFGSMIDAVKEGAKEMELKVTFNN